MRYLILILFSWNSLQAGSLDDSTSVSLTEVLALAQQYHPIIRQANLQPGFAEAELKTARGQLDPKLNSDYALKNFNGTQYYNSFNGSLKVPIWFPLDPKIEVIRNSGNYLNPENYISSSTDFWQVTSGVSLPLGKGLFIDERRAMIQQAKIYSTMAEAERIKLTNQTLLTIIKSYWDWYISYQEYMVLKQSIEISQSLKQQVKLDFTFGEASVMDTVQAEITYQSRKVSFEKAQLAVAQARFQIEIHLWGENQTPFELDKQAKPEATSTFSVVPDSSGLELIVAWSENHHPEIQKISSKQKQLEVEERWNKESLKPEVNVSYSLIDSPLNYQGTQTPDWNDNYKLGVDFAFPLFLRKERGKLQKTQLYLESTGFDLTQTRQQIKAGIRSAYAELKTNERLVKEFEKMSKNYRVLFEAELFNLENGESDLFKLNIQQEKYLDAQIKYFESLGKLEKLKAYLPYAAGLPNLSYQSLYE